MILDFYLSLPQLTLYKGCQDITGSVSHTDNCAELLSAFIQGIRKKSVVIGRLYAENTIYCVQQTNLYPSGNSGLAAQDFLRNY